MLGRGGRTAIWTRRRPLPSLARPLGRRRLVVDLDSHLDPVLLASASCGAVGRLVRSRSARIGGDPAGCGCREAGDPVKTGLSLVDGGRWRRCCAVTLLEASTLQPSSLRRSSCSGGNPRSGPSRIRRWRRVQRRLPLEGIVLGASAGCGRNKVERSFIGGIEDGESRRQGVAESR